MNGNIGILIPRISENVHFSIFSRNDYLIFFGASKRYVKISSETYNLLSCVDGQSNLDKIVKKFESQFGLIISVEFVYSLLYEKFSKYGLLDCHIATVEKAGRPSYLKLSFTIFRKEYVAKIAKAFHFLFKLKYSIPLIFLSLGILIYGGVDNFSLFKEFELQKSVVYFFCLMFLSVTFHEIGHAASSSYFGAEHGGIGGGFYLFSPVYYADVSDIWRLHKWQRIVVNISGMYFELLFCSFSVLIGIVIRNFLLVILSIIVCLKTLNNLNPLIRSDGYWVLSDITNTPNLFYHAFRKIAEILQWIFTKRKINWQFSDCLLLIYGIISYSFIGMFLYYILIENPNSIIKFPENLFSFFKALFSSGTMFSMLKYAELIIPVIFFYLLFNWIKVSIRYMIKKLIKPKMVTKVLLYFNLSYF